MNLKLPGHCETTIIATSKKELRFCLASGTSLDALPQAVTSPHNLRTWLSGTELFEDSSTGLEDLSLRGKALLDSALAPYSDSSEAGPIVVEGYWAGDDPNDQIAFSRVRAILVKQYLQNRLHIDSANIGIVSLKNSPPPGLGHPSWDGICIVLPHKASS